MVESLVTAWRYTDQDKILHFLPLHHLHGVLNKLLCVLYAGGHVEFVPSANPVELWRRLARDSRCVHPVTMFMAVPTIYARMLEAARAATLNPSGGELSKEELESALEVFRAMRLIVSGSAALPIPVLNEWNKLIGSATNRIVERFGMTEIGMGLSGDADRDSTDRVPGTVGYPLPTVQARLVDDNGVEVNQCGLPGELRIKVT